jgi:predicted phosphate transport protein (TIGR00153 family)
MTKPADAGRRSTDRKRRFIVHWTRALPVADEASVGVVLAIYALFQRDIVTCQSAVTALCATLHSFRDIKEQARRIHDIEYEGDRITAEIFALLQRTFITPFERDDIIALGSIIDDVLDQVDEVVTMLVLYRVTQPSVYLLEASELLERTVGALVPAIGRLESLSGLEPSVKEVHRIETEADGLYQNAIAELFLPDTYPPLEVLKWTRLYDVIERAFDKCEDVANVLENVVLKNA